MNYSELTDAEKIEKIQLLIDYIEYYRYPAFFICTSFDDIGIHCISTDLINDAERFNIQHLFSKFYYDAHGMSENPISEEIIPLWNTFEYDKRMEFLNTLIKNLKNAVGDKNGC